ncbi:hypothetical protein J3E72DRAFT_371489 [Bipolaris maydis]|nr:hypothetical protein J3E72DRAFT_371489 [Bipolaris maydis]
MEGTPARFSNPPARGDSKSPTRILVSKEDEAQCVLPEESPLPKQSPSSEHSPSLEKFPSPKHSVLAEQSQLPVHPLSREHSPLIEQSLPAKLASSPNQCAPLEHSLSPKQPPLPEFSPLAEVSPSPEPSPLPEQLASQEQASIPDEPPSPDPCSSPEQYLFSEHISSTEQCEPSEPPPAAEQISSPEQSSSPPEQPASPEQPLPSFESPSLNPCRSSEQPSSLETSPSIKVSEPSNPPWPPELPSSAGLSSSREDRSSSLGFSLSPQEYDWRGRPLPSLPSPCPLPSPAIPSSEPLIPDRYSSPAPKTTLEKLLEWPIPAPILSMLRTDNKTGDFYLTHADLLSYFHNHREDTNVPTPPFLNDPDNMPSITMNLSDLPSISDPLPSIDLLPYLLVYTRCPDVVFRTWGPPIVHDRIYKFFTELVIPRRAFWTRCVADNLGIREVRIFCEWERTVDIVLDPGRAWISLVKFEIWLLFIDYDNVASGQMKDVR